METHDPRSTSGRGPDTDASPGGPSGLPLAEIFDHVRGLGVARPDQGRWAAGVCAGLARRWALDPVLVRGLFVVAGIVSGIGIGLYGLLWLFLPEPDGRIHAQQILRGTVTAGFLGGVALVVIEVSDGAPHLWGDGGPFGGLAFLAVVGFGIWWFVNRGTARTGGTSAAPADPKATGGAAPANASTGAGSATAPTWSPAGSTTTTDPGSTGTPVYGSPGPAPTTAGSPAERTGAVPPYGVGYAAPGAPPTLAAPRPTVSRPVDRNKPLHSITFATLGVALLVAAGVLFWSRVVAPLPSEEGVVAAGAALGVVAIGIVVSGAVGRRSGGLAPIAVLLAVVSLAGAAWRGTDPSVRTELTWRPTQAPTSPFTLTAGRAVLDLTDPGLAAAGSTPSPVTLPVEVSVGQLVVVVPKDRSVEVNAEVSLGNIADELDAGTPDRGGNDLRETLRHGDGPVAVIVDARMSFGEIRVVPEGTEVP